MFDTMKKMTKIDIHCHILPGLDDGARDVPETVTMVQMAVNQGIQGVIVTPHHSAGFTKATPEIIRAYCAKLEAAFQKKIHENFRFFPGQELLYSDNTLEKLKKGQVLTLADSNYVLLEFLPDVNYSYLFTAIRRMTADNYRPVLAHAERYGVLRVKGRMDEVIEAGAYIQMNYRSIGGTWYNETTRWCRSMLKQQKVHFLGTDMHNDSSRCPETAKAEIWMQKHLSEDYLQRICFSNAESILKNIRI